MAKVVKRTFSLTQEQAKFIDSKVESGAYASGSEVVREGIRGLEQDEAVVERWLREAVLPVYDRVKAGEGKLLSRAQLRASLNREYRKLTKAAE